MDWREEGLGWRRGALRLYPPLPFQCLIASTQTALSSLAPSLCPWRRSLYPFSLGFCISLLTGPTTPVSPWMESLSTYTPMNFLQHKYHDICPHLKTSRTQVNITLPLFSAYIESSGNWHGRLNTEAWGPVAQPGNWDELTGDLKPSSPSQTSCLHSAWQNWRAPLNLEIVPNLCIGYLLYGKHSHTGSSWDVWSNHHTWRP